MRVAALVLGILGGLAGLAGGAYVLAVGGLDEAFGGDSSEELYTMGWLAVVAGIGGLIGAGMAMTKPKIAAALMAISAVVGLSAVSFAFLFAAILFGIGALMAFLGRNEKEKSAA